MKKPKRIIIEVGKSFDKAILERAKERARSKGFKLASQRLGKEKFTLIFKPIDKEGDFDPEALLTDIAKIIYKANGVEVTAEWPACAGRPQEN